MDAQVKTVRQIPHSGDQFLVPFLLRCEVDAAFFHLTA